MAGVAALLLRPGRHGEEVRVANRLILEKMEEAETTVEQWRREEGTIPDSATFVDAALRDARHYLRGGRLARAAGRMDQAQMAVHAEAQLRKFERMAEHVEREGGHLSFFRRIAKDTRTKLREGRVEELDPALPTIQEGMKSVCALYESELRRKLETIEARMEACKTRGRDVSAAVALLSDFQPLCQTGRVLEADAVLGRALAMLE